MISPRRSCMTAVFTKEMRQAWKSFEYSHVYMYDRVFQQKYALIISEKIEPELLLCFDFISSIGRVEKTWSKKYSTCEIYYDENHWWTKFQSIHFHKRVKKSDLYSESAARYSLLIKTFPPKKQSCNMPQL